MLLGFCLDNDIFGLDTKSKGNKNKGKQVRLHQTKMLYTAKETINKMKRQPTDWEKRITKHTSDKVISRIHKNLYSATANEQTKSKTPKLRQSDFKKGRGLE